MAKIISTNPAKNYEIVGEVDVSTDKEITQKVTLANDAKRAWKELEIKKRIALLKKILEKFNARAEDIAICITKEMGKTIKESHGEVKSAFKKYEWFLQNAESALADQITFEDAKSKHVIVYEPYGVAAVITPWNYPFSMAIWGIIPHLVVGNTVVFKTSEECPLIGKIIDEVMANELPKGVFSQVYGAGDVGEKLARSDVQFIWFTGSSKVGKLLYKVAAEKFIKVVLELGGSNAGIVFEDAQPKEYAEVIYEERFSNNGQSCDSLKRLIVQESQVEKITSELRKIILSKKVGDPFDEKTDSGSLVAKRQVDLLSSQVEDAIQKGAKIIAGGKIPSHVKGAFYEPTILTNITKDMRVWKEEVFGPALPIITFKTEEEAIALANDTIYGLGNRIFSNDKKRIERVASRLEAGTVEVNKSSRWLPCNPFGGYKNSGIGREHGVVGFRELCQIKVISMDK